MNSVRGMPVVEAKLSKAEIKARILASIKKQMKGLEA
jgi:hypothetical protein